MMHQQERQASCRNSSCSNSSSSSSNNSSCINGNCNNSIPSMQSTSSSARMACRAQSRRALCMRRPMAQLRNNIHQQYRNPSANVTWSPAPIHTSGNNSTSLLSVLAWSMTLLLVSSCLGIADAGALMGHPFSKRSFMDIQCKGVYDKALFARLDRICEDCYNLFREPQLHTLCRKNCFTSDYFKGCLDVLLLQDEMEWIQTSIKQLHGADPGV